MKDEQVVILDDRLHRPIFHRRGEGVYVKDLRRHQWYTACGSAIGFWVAYLRRSHADCFAVPCKRCFPRALKRTGYVPELDDPR